MSDLIPFIPFIPAVFAIIMIAKSVYVIREDWRLAVFRFGRFYKVLKPGVNVLVPMIERGVKVELKKSIPAWKSYSQLQLNQKIKEILTSSGDAASAAFNSREAEHFQEAKSGPELERLQNWLVDMASQQCGVNIKNDPLATKRISEQASMVLSEINENGKSEVNIPYLTADASGPKHFSISIDKKKLQEI